MLASNTTNSTLYRQTLNRMGWSMLLFIGLFNATTTVSTAVDAVRTFITSPLWANVFTVIYGVLSPVCYMFPFFMAGWFFYILSRRTRADRVLFEVKLPREFPLLILAGIAILTAGAYVNSWFCTAIGYTIPEEMSVAGVYDDPSMVILYMSVALAPAFAEEFLFRGVFYTNLRPYGRTQAILISSLLFALMHQNIGQLFYTFVAGIAMALMYELTGSIWCSVFFHLLNNELSIISEVIYYGWGGATAEACLTVFDAILFLLGIISLILLIVYYKKQAACRNMGRVSGIFGVREETALRGDRPLSASSVVKGALCPGMIVFTAVTVALMGMTWLMLEILNSGVLM